MNTSKPQGKLIVRWKNLIRLQVYRGIPRLKLPAGFKLYVTWGLRILTAIGIGSSVVAFSKWYSSLGFSLALFSLEQFLERTVFVYAVIYVQPLPDFSYDPNEWVGMGFAFPQEKNELNLVGPVFRSVEYARKFFDLLKKWNYDLREDPRNNVCVSFIVEEDNKYTVYLYPNRDRPSVTAFFSEFQKKQKQTDKGEYDRLIMQMKFAHSFPLIQGSQFDKFVENQKKIVHSGCSHFCGVRTGNMKFFLT